MEQVSRDEVLKEWLDLEQRKDSSNGYSINSNVEKCERAARLLAHEPDAASIFWKHDFDWHRHKVTKKEIRTLQTVWEKENNIFEAAKAIQEGRSSLSEDKIERIESIAARDSVEDLGPLVIYRRKGLRTGPFLADGNHRAIGVALHTLDNNHYRKQTAFVGYPTKAYSKRVRGIFHRILGRI